VLVSITPEIAIEEVPIYAGGLGVLEGDKFIEASKLNKPYLVLTLFYPKGYANYALENGIIELNQDYSEYEKNLNDEGDFEIKTNLGYVKLKALSLSKESSKVVFFKAVYPDWAVKATSKLYIEESKFDYEYKYVILAKASVEYINRLEDVNDVYAQESLAGLALIPLHKRFRTHLVIHTPGPWGHPVFSSKTLQDEFGILLDEKEVVLTKLLIKYADDVHTVSLKHNELTKKMFPRSDFTSITNGVSFTRWMHDEIKKVYFGGNLENLTKARKIIKEEFLKFLKNYKEEINKDAFIVVWARRMTKYKRPYLISRIIRDIGNKLDNVMFVIAGKAHPKDYDGINYMNEFASLSRENKNVIYIHDYTIKNAKIILSGGDLLLFTPFSGWEACGTSYMKAGINGVPTLSSKDGGALEVIVDGYNGWFFGEDIRDFIDIFHSSIKDIDEKDYSELVSKFLYIVERAGKDPEWYNQITKNTFISFVKFSSITKIFNSYFL